MLKHSANQRVVRTGDPRTARQSAHPRRWGRRMKLLGSLIIGLLMLFAPATAGATTVLWCVVEAINTTTNDDWISSVLDPDANVSSEAVHRFCIEAHELFGRIKLVHDKVPPEGTKTLKSIGKQPNRPENTIRGLLQTEKMGICTVELQRENGKASIAFIVINGKPVNDKRQPDSNNKR